MFMYHQSPLLSCLWCNVNGKLIFFGESIHTFDVVRMLVRNEKGFYFFKRQSQPLHPDFRFAARKPCVHQHRLLPIADVIAITIATGV